MRETFQCLNPDADDVRPELLAEWLLVNGLAEEERGYGHVSAGDLAEALLERYRISLRHIDGLREGDDADAR